MMNLTNLVTKIVTKTPVILTDDVVDKTRTVLENIMTKVKGIATPVAVLAAIFCGVKLLVASDPQSVKSAKSWLLTIVIGLLVIYLADPLVTTVVTLLTSTS